MNFRTDTGEEYVPTQLMRWHMVLVEQDAPDYMQPRQDPMIIGTPRKKLRAMMPRLEQAWRKMDGSGEGVLWWRAVPTFDEKEKPTRAPWDDANVVGAAHG